MKARPFEIKGEIVLPGAETLPESPREKRLRIITRIFLFASAFLIPALTALAVFASYGFAPFGQKSMLIMDMSGQYVEFLSQLRTVHSPADLFFSWGKVMGGNYIGVYAYYASSPLSWLLLLFPDQKMPEAILFLTVLKIGLCGLGMSVLLRGFCLRCSRFLRSRSGRAAVPAFPAISAISPRSSAPRHNSVESLSPALIALILLFSTLYALCSYNCVYSMCVMWLDGVFMLPLIIYFIDKLYDTGSIAGLIISFAYIFISNYYVAYMCGAFAVLYFIFCLIDRSGRLGGPGGSGKSLAVRFYLNRSGKFALAVAVAAALTAWLWLPTLFSLFEGKIGFSNSAYPDNNNYDLNAFIRKLFIGEYDAITNSGAPFFYGGMAVFVAVPMFFMNRKIRGRSRIAAGLVLALLLFSTFWTPLDKAWHIFQHPNWFPYRWTFVLAFFSVYLGFRGAAASGSLSVGYYPGAMLGMYALCLAVTRAQTSASPLSSTNFIAPSDGSVRRQFIYTLAVVLSFILIGLARRLPSRYVIAAGEKFRIRLSQVLAGLVSLCLIAVTVTEQHYHWKKLLEGVDGGHHYETAASYSEYRKIMAETLNVIDGDRANYGIDGFGGIGQNFSRSYNEAIGFGYRSVAHYSSAFNRHVNEFLGNFGYAQAYLWNLNFGSTAVTDSIFGIRYMLNGTGIAAFDEEDLVEIGSVTAPSEYEYIETVSGVFDIAIYRNQYAVSGPFLMAGDASEFRWDYNCFESQNLLMKLSSGIDKNVFNRVGSGQISISLSDGAYEESGRSGVYSSSGGKVTYGIFLPEGGTLYAYFGRNSNNEARLTVGDSSDSVRLYRGETNCIQRIGTYGAGETAYFTITIGSWSSLFTQDNIFYVLDADALSEHSAALNSRTLSIESFSTGLIKGTLPSDNPGGTMLIQVPYDSGWTVKADGVRVNTSALKDGLLKAEIPAGTASIEIRFVPNGLLPGAAVSASMLLLIAVDMAIRIIKRKKRASKAGAAV